MAIVKQGPRRIVDKKQSNAQKYEKYLLKGCSKDMEPHYENCSENWAKDFELTAASWNDLKNNLAIEYVQSWEPGESNRIGAERLMEIGIETAREVYPGHQFAVVPHVSKKGNYHNHILVCTVSAETGARIESKFGERGRFTQATDRRCIELGLTVQDRTKSKAREKLSKSAHQQLSKRGTTPIDLQIMKAADGVRTLAVDLDTFVRDMLSLGFRVEDRGKVLTYFHPDRKKGIRDRHLGANYNKEGLNERFEHNRKVFKERPELLGILRPQLHTLYDGKGHLVGDASEFPFAPGGHQRFENRPSPGEKGIVQVPANGGDRDNHLSTVGGLLARHVDATRSLSIVDYCKKHRIAIDENADGTYRLRYREHINISETTWKSTKENNGKPIGGGGGLLEFVQNFKSVSVFGALAELTGNNRFLELDEHFGAAAPSYKEFHVPKFRLAPEKTALDHLGAFAKAIGKNSAWSKAVLNSKRVQVTTEGAVRLIFGKGEGAVEHKKDSKGQWIKRKFGVLRGGLISQEGSSGTMHVFRDPFAFMEATCGRGKMGFPASASLLVLGDEMDDSLDFFLSANPHIKKVQFVGFGPSEQSVGRYRLLSRDDIKFEFMQVGGATRGKAKGIDLGIDI